VCGICGAVAKDGTSDTAGQVLLMLKEMSHRGPDSAGIAWDGGTVTAPTMAELLRRAENVRAPRTLGHARLRITGGDRGLQPFFDAARRLSLVFNGEIYNFKALMEKHPDWHSDTDGEVLFRVVAEHHTGDLVAAVREAATVLDGVYAFSAMDRDSVVLIRDRVGVKQVYFGENERLVAFASERKALWQIGLRSRRLNPGEILHISPAGATRIPRGFFPVLAVVYTNRAQALPAYRRVIVEAVRKRVEGHRKVGVLFSGGVDSVLVAKIAAQFCHNVTGYIGGVPGSPDLAHAVEAARAIGLPLRVRELDGPAIRELVPETIAAIEDGDLMQVEVAVPMYAALRLAREDGVRVMLTGQGADELFAGYEWYPPILAEQGEAALLAAMWGDLSNLYRDTLEREDKMSMAHSIELRVPFLDPSVITEAMRISPSLKIDTAARGRDPLRKRLHRELALEMGVPRSIAMRLKDGAQHGSGIHVALEKVAKESAPSPERQPISLDEPEQRGSAFRHGGIDVREGIYGSPEARAYVSRAARRVFEPILGA
jgi:asparagine synthase (glutamine-hydrolysing)